MARWFRIITPVIFIVVCVGLLGLAVGSFLNVVIARLPRMLDADWRASARDILELPPQDTPRFDLAWPGSACPNCQARIRAWQNIPVVSFVLQRGRCAACHAPISWQYPLVEIAAAALALACVWQFGLGTACALAIILSWALLTLAVIDWRTQLLPDNITLPLLWLGLLTSISGIITDPVSAIVGAAAGYLVLWFIYQLFRLLTGKRGMGYGDFKLLAALGAWLGWQQLPVIVVIAATSGAIIGLLLIASGRLQRDRPMPFGPFLALAGWLSLIAGDTMLQNYMALAGLS